MAEQGAKSFEFSSFRLDFISGQLLRGDRPIALRPKTWAVLRHLVDRRGALVTRDELLDTVWQGSAVCDDNLSQSISEIRRALGEDARHPRFLETVHGRGFRFLVAATERGAEVDSRPPPLPLREFVGRESELRRLAELLVAAHAGRRRLAFVTGEPGTGKTSLVEAFLCSLEESDELWIARGQSIEQYGVREPYMPFLEALERLTRRPDGKEAIDAIRRLAPSWSAEIETLRGQEARVPVELTPARMLREMAGALEELTRGRTLVLVLEDLHWSDPSTVDLLGLLARRPERARLFVIGTYRPAEAAVGDHPIAMLKAALEAHAGCEEIPLEDLTRDEVTAYLRRRYPECDELDRLGGWLHRRSDGSPLFMVALSDRVIAPRLERSAVIDESDLDGAEIPRDLTALIETQLAPLDERQRRLLDAASIAGLTFDAQALGAALGMPLLEIEDACARLVHTHGLLVEETVSEWPDGSVAGRYAFRHALYHRFLDERIAPATRRSLHQAIAERLERAWGGRAAEIAADLARHFEEAGDRMRAVKYFGQAGCRALGRAAFREARGCFETGLQHLRQLPESRDRDRLEVELLQPLAVILAGDVFYSGRDLEPTLERTMHLCERLEDRRGLFEARFALWACLGVRGDRAKTHAALAELESIAGEVGGARRVYADYARCSTMLWGGEDLDTALAVAERAFSAEETAADRELKPGQQFGIDPIVGAGVYAGCALWLLGFPSRAREVEHRALARAERLERPFTLVQALVEQAIPNLACGQLNAALDFSSRARAIATEYGLPAWTLLADVIHSPATVMSTGGRGQLAALRRALDEYLASGSLICSPFYAFFAEASLALGEAATGLAVVREGLTKIENALDQFFTAELRRLEGELILAAEPKVRKRGRGGSDARTEAARCFDAAIERARRQKARVFELRALTSLVRLQRLQGVRETARPQLEAVFGRFTDGFELPDLVAAKRVLGGI